MCVNKDHPNAQLLAPSSEESKRLPKRSWTACLRFREPSFLEGDGTRDNQAEREGKGCCLNPVPKLHDSPRHQR